MRDSFPLSSTVRALALAIVVSVVTGYGAQPGPNLTPAPDQTARAAVGAVPFPDIPIPADAHVRGMWSPVYPWPLISVHIVLMPDGRVMSYGTDGAGRQTGYFIYDVWEPTAGLDGGHLTLPNGTNTDLFCGSQVVLPQGGGVFLAGGDNWTGTATTNTGNNNTNVFDYGANSLTRGNNMNRARWYSSSTVLLNGEVYIQGGSGGTDRPEIRAANGTFRLLNSANTSSFNFMYPRNFIAPDGRVFGYESSGKMYYISTSGDGAVTQVGQITTTTGNDASAAMFRPGRILQFGGSSNAATVIDITGGGTPVVTPTQSMSSQRRLVNATILADGKVVATGGSSVWNQLTNVNNTAEIWNPDTGTWLQGAVGDRARLYHSNSLLLPDASVLVAGGGAPGPQTNLNVEMFYPPYLFTAAGTLAARPQITSAPATLEIGATFYIDVAQTGNISRVTLIKAGSATHSWNMEQRFTDLTFAAAGGRLAIQAPTRAADAPPGHYLLFVIDNAGVPSVAKMVRVNVASNPNPAVTPTLANPGSQSSNVGATVDLQLVASDPNGDVLTYFASGLPPGLTLNAASGRITGSTSAQGSYNVVVTASDGINSASQSFVWTVTGAGPLVLNLSPPAPVIAGNAVTFSASSNGVNPLYNWSFGDGSADSGWASSGSVSHTYTRAGVFSVTVTAIDDLGRSQTKSFLQQVHLPQSSARSASSSTIAFEPRSGGNSRVWVVNQDNDSVTAFDAITRAKVAEIAVGTAPRAIALAPDGALWVTNKQSASISVINPAMLAVSRTIALTRASQPYGIVFAPGGYAYVALAATGQAAKIDVTSFTQVASVGVGANPRNLAIANDGAILYVSRFISPPLPGEHTAVVQTTIGGEPAGGEVVVVDAAAMSVTRTIVLRHSDRPDFENQGRGVPNYLGAPAVSPDGTQAWVPSKQDNVRRGALRDGTGLNFQNTVRSISSRIDLATQVEDANARVDHDNAGLASAAVFDARGVYLFVALETSREVAVLDAHGRYELLRFDVGRAPQALALSADSATLYVNNFMDRTLGVFDLRPLLNDGLGQVPALATLAAVGSERLSAQVLLGKRLFYDARDPRLARDRYISCASCHNDGGHDGRVWDLTGVGEGLRNTASLRGRAAGQGFLHWSNNFDELHDFEGQIRGLSGGTGLMTDAQFNTGTRSQPLGDPKAGVSTDLDALAAYVASLNAFDTTPYRTSGGALTAAGAAGKAVFTTLNCGSCHAGAAFTASGANNPANVGTIKPSSGNRLGGPLTGIDIPTLRDVWSTAPYLHDGSAATLGDAVRAHSGVSVSDTDLANLVAYLREIGREESSAPTSAGTGSGLTGNYYNNVSLTGAPALTRVEQVNFNWGSGSPGTGVNADNFSVRWSGFVEASTTGTYRFRTVSDDGVRLWVSGVQLINNWTDHGATTNTSGTVSLVAGQRYPITMEFYEKGVYAVARLRWRTPGATSYVAIPANRLYQN